jgi:hypothetical protein
MLELVRRGVSSSCATAAGENYWGLHQWNIDSEHGEFVIFRGRGEKVSMSRRLADVATVECSVEDGWVVCLMTRGAGRRC